jgi:hypothetical protein
MRLKNKTLLFAASVIALLFLPHVIWAQETGWSNCPDGEKIARCETYDCPKGDTNKDGVCNLSDDGARYSDSRNDSFCSNPTSGCGEVRYYKSGAQTACTIRIKESGSNCDLYNAGNPVFSSPTPTPVSTPKPTFKPVPTSTPKAIALASQSSTLPETGPELFVNLFLIATGILGIYIYERYRA